MGKTDTYHNHILNKFVEKKEDQYNNIIKREAARKIMYFSHIPLYMHSTFLGEMEHLGLIKIKDKQNIEILKNE